MDRATIIFKGEAFQALIWEKLLVGLGYRSGGIVENCIFSKNGNHIIGIPQGFTNYGEENAFKWVFYLKQTRRWEGKIVYLSTLLSAFEVPQKIEITIGELTFASFDYFRKYSEDLLIEEFGLEELILNNIYQEGYGFKFF